MLSKRRYIYTVTHEHEVPFFWYLLETPRRRVNVFAVSWAERCAMRTRRVCINWYYLFAIKLIKWKSARVAVLTDVKCTVVWHFQFIGGDDSIVCGPNDENVKKKKSNDSEMYSIGFWHGTRHVFTKLCNSNECFHSFDGTRAPRAIREYPILAASCRRNIFFFFFQNFGQG